MRAHVGPSKETEKQTNKENPVYEFLKMYKLPLYK